MASLPGYDWSAVDQRVRAYVANGIGTAASQARAMPLGPSGAVTLTPGTIPITVGGVTKNVPTVLVTVTYNHNFLLLGPVLGLINKTWGGTIVLTARSQMRAES
jgi:hypothetical protein